MSCVCLSMSLPSDLPIICVDGIGSGPHGLTAQDDDKEDDEDEDEEEASVAMVYLPRPQKPFGELGLIQPIQPSESPIVALEGPKPPDQLKVIYVPSWDVTAQVSTASVAERELGVVGARVGSRAGGG